jgi:hypothetical protein
MRRSRVHSGFSVLVVATVSLAGGVSTSSQAVEPPSPIAGYLAALDAGDIDGAMAYRCASLRPDLSDPAARSSFVSQVARLKAELGTLRASSIENTGKRVNALNGTKGVQQRYRFRFDNDETRWLTSVVVKEEGRELMCGFSTDVGRDYARRLPTRVRSTDRKLPTLSDFATPSGAEFKLVEEPAAKVNPNGDERKAVEVWSKAWKRGNFGGARVTAYRFATSTDAVAAVRAAVKRTARDASATFNVAPLKGAVAVRVLGEAWTLAQAPEFGDVCDDVRYVATDTEIRITMCGMKPSENHEVVLALASDAAAKLTSTR